MKIFILSEFKPVAWVFVKSVDFNFLTWARFINVSALRITINKPFGWLCWSADVQRCCYLLATIESVQWRSYRGFRRFNEPGPPSSWGPPSQATKKLNKKIIGILLKKTNNQSLYQRQLCASEQTVSTSMTFLVCVYSLYNVVLTAEMWMFQFVYFFNVVKHLYFAHLFFSRNLR